MAREQRKLAAILAADVVGYSHLMGRDESGTLARLREHRKQRFEPILARHGGRLVKLMGDGALVEFASAVDALSAAIEFQQVMAEANDSQPAETAIVFRIGLHLGDLIVDGDDLYGDSVNVAARLETEAPVGGIVVLGDVHNAVSGRLKASFADLGELSLKNIDRPVRAFRVHVDGISAVSSTAAPPPKVVQDGLTALATTTPALTLPDKPSIAVLPFQNNGDPEQEYFADGITEDIITELSRCQFLFVIARNSSFTYKGRAIDIRNVGRELGVRYVLEGSIRRARERIRVTGQLIDTMTGTHIWAERYDRVLEDVFAVQEELTEAIVSAIAPQVEAAEVAKSVRLRPGNLGAYELALGAWANARDAYTKSDANLRADALTRARQALTLDARCSLALITISFVRWTQLMYGLAENTDAARTEGAAAANRVIEYDPSNHFAFTIRGMLQYRAGQRRAGLNDLHHAHQLNPNDATSLFSLGFHEAAFGDAFKGIEQITKAIRLSPRDPWRATMQQNLAFARFLARQYREGADTALVAVREAPEMASCYTSLSLNLVGLGEIENATAAFENMRRFAPAYATARITNGFSLERPEDEGCAVSFLRIAAGLENPSAAEALR